MNQQKYHWTKLDVAAKIFPCSTSKQDTKVFRVFCDLNEPIDINMLQTALNTTILDFPIFSYVIKRGIFWYYLEETDLKPVVCQEYDTPCSLIYEKDFEGLLYRVTFYKNRINIEAYHSLTDGAGITNFARVLIFRYLQLSHPAELANVPPVNCDSSPEQSMTDSFEYYASEHAKNIKTKFQRVYHIRGSRRENYALSVVEGTTSVSKMLEYAHEKHTTLTAVLATALLLAFAAQMPIKQRKFPVTMSVPINLRKHFSSASLRNFFSVISIKYCFSDGIPSFDELLLNLDKQLKDEMSMEKLQFGINRYIKLINNPFSRIVPLSSKDFCMQIGHDITKLTGSTSLSNLGVVAMPKECDPYIHKFGACISTPYIQLCTVSYKDQLNMTFSSIYESCEIQKNFFRTLTNLGMPVEIDTN